MHAWCVWDLHVWHSVSRCSRDRRELSDSCRDIHARGEQLCSVQPHANEPRSYRSWFCMLSFARAAGHDEEVSREPLCASRLSVLPWKFQFSVQMLASPYIYTQREDQQEAGQEVSSDWQQGNHSSWRTLKCLWFPFKGRTWSQSIIHTHITHIHIIVQYRRCFLWDLIWASIHKEL